MKTLIDNKSPQVRRIPSKKEDRSDANATVHIHNNGLYLLRKQFHLSLDINQPAQIDLHNQSPCFTGHEVNSQNEAAPRETRKRSMIEPKMNDKYEGFMGLDLKLKLSPPGSSICENLSNALKFTSSWTSPLPSSSSSSTSCQGLTYIISSSLDSHDENLGVNSNDKDEVPSLIVMGCTRCHIYVMVSEADPKCFNCDNPMLLDEFRQNPAKKLRKISRI